MRSLQLLIAAVLFTLITARTIENSKDILSIRDFIKSHQMSQRVGEDSFESNDKQKEQLDRITYLVVQKLQDLTRDGGDEELADYINQTSDRKSTLISSPFKYVDELISNTIEQRTVRDQQKLTTEAPFYDADELMANNLRNMGKQISSTAAPIKDLNRIANDAIEKMLSLETPEEISSTKSKGRL